MYRGRILIVDDEPVICNLLEDILSENNFKVTAVTSAVTALTVMKDHRFDLVISDISMPKMDGITFLKKAKAAYPDTIFLIMTGHATLETARASIKTGAYDYILKPFNIHDILLAIEHAFERNKLMIENSRLKELVTFFEIGKALESSFELESILSVIIRNAVTQTQAQEGICALFTDSGELIVECRVPKEGQLIMDTRNIDLGSTRIEDSISDNKTIILTAPNESEPYKDMTNAQGDIIVIEANEKGLCDIIIPIAKNRELYGIIDILKPAESGVFSKADIDLLRTLAMQTSVAVENAKLLKSLEDTYINTLKTLTLTLEAKSAYTKGHSERVMKLSTKIAERMKLDTSTREVILYGSSLHDVGKIGVSEAILNKTTKLTPEEYDEVKRHPVIGDEILKPIQYLDKPRELVRWHHERLDGTGFPDGIKDASISLPVRIIMAADAYDAMASSRPYKREYDLSFIEEEIDRNMERQFDKEVIHVLLTIVKEKP